jgi:hypothetical protein
MTFLNKRNISTMATPAGSGFSAQVSDLQMETK